MGQLRRPAELDRAVGVGVGTALSPVADVGRASRTNNALTDAQLTGPPPRRAVEFDAVERYTSGGDRDDGDVAAAGVARWVADHHLEERLLHGCIGQLGRESAPPGADPVPAGLQRSDRARRHAP